MKLAKLSCLLLAGGIILAGCGKSDSDKSEKPQSESNDKGISTAEYNKLPYKNYFSKSDVEKSDGQYYVDSDKAVDIEKKLVEKTKGAEYLKKAESVRFENNPESVQNKVNLILKGDELDNAALHFKLNGYKTYTKDELLAKHLYNAKEYDGGAIGIGNPDNPDDRLAEDDYSNDINGGVVEVDFEYKNKISEEINLDQLLHLFVDNEDVGIKIVSIKGKIDGKSVNKDYNNVQDIVALVKLQKDQVFKGKIAFSASMQDINKDKILYGKFMFGEPLNETYFGFKKDLK